MSAHTPGPWRSDSFGSVRTKKGSVVAMGIMSESDAALIAAAPELLEALKAMYDEGLNASTAEMAIAVIEKAEGRE